MLTEVLENQAKESPPPHLSEALRSWLRLGCISFGGTAAHIAIMHDDFVARKRWISNEDFFHALSHCMILPGPEAQQLAIYIGWKLHGIKGGFLAGTLFVLPSMFVLLVLSIAYARFGNLPWISALFGGLKPAVLALLIFRFGSARQPFPGYTDPVGRCTWSLHSSDLAACFDPIGDACGHSYRSRTG